MPVIFKRITTRVSCRQEAQRIGGQLHPFVSDYSSIISFILNDANNKLKNTITEMPTVSRNQNPIISEPNLWLKNHPKTEPKVQLKAIHRENITRYFSFQYSGQS